MGENNTINYSKEGQGELFPEFKAASGKRFAYIKKEMALGKKMVVSISWENLVLAIIVFIMLIAVFFSLGVEKGKRLAIKNMRTIKKAVQVETAVPREQAAPAVSGTQAVDSSVKLYTIQVMALKKSDEAQKEVARLVGMGHKAFVILSGGWYQVCVGKYAIPTEASKDLTAIKTKYPSCYIRKLSN